MLITDTVYTMANYGVEEEVVSNTCHHVLWGVKILVRISNASTF